ncbi:MAG: hypothetical protein DRG39_01075 [Deltaproteobacteria bacterium]|nr:MAG: hypothetical protein DRG39_01075 [Deltaproteobacteria bacterium]
MKVEKEIIKRIEQAEKLYAQYGKTISNDETVKDIIAHLEQVIEKRRRCMISCGMTDICRRCDTEEGGSCCGKGIEARYDEWLLLINLLLGCNLPRERYEDNSCLFLGKDGCILKALHVICINYLCKKIEERVSRDDLLRLRDMEGDMIAAIFCLHEYLKRSYSKHEISEKDPAKACTVL